MDVLLFFPVAAVILAAPLIWLLWRSPFKPGATHMVLIAVASGEIEMELWKGALQSAGIRPRVVNVGHAPWAEFVSQYAYEIWVREKDAQRARRVLGL